jgi:uncharacterized membrane protein
MALSTLSTVAKINIAGLLAAAVGIVIQIASGVDYPTVPPGLIILLVTAGLVAFARWAWVAIVGVIVPLFLLVGGTISSTGRDNLADPGDFGQFAGTLIQLVAVVVALVAALLVVRDLRTRRQQRV